MERIGQDTGLMTYEATGGQCPRPDCDADAPLVVVLGKRLPIPCNTHSMEEIEEENRAELESRAVSYLLSSGATERMLPAAAIRRVSEENESVSSIADRGWSLATYAAVCGDEAGLEALAVAQRWLKTFHDTGAGTNLLFYGEVGSGKTGLAWGMVRDLCEHGVQAKIINFRKLLDEMKDAFSQKVATSKWMASLIHAEVLCLDDLGSEVPTEWACGQLLGMVDARYERGLPTIYVSNYDPGSLGKRLGHRDEIVGKRIVSRMTEGAKQHRFGSGDRRVRKAA